MKNRIKRTLLGALVVVLPTLLLGILVHPLAAIVAWLGVFYFIDGIESDEVKELNDRDMVRFGNYLLSEERDAITSEANKFNVTDADLANYKNYDDEK